MNTPDSDGIDEALQGATRVALTAAARLGEHVARMRELAARQAQASSEQAAREYGERVRAERSAARAALAPVHRSDWWDSATREDVTLAYQTAAAWRQADPEAERAYARLVDEVRTRFGVDVAGRDGADVTEELARRQAAEQREQAGQERAEAAGLMLQADAVDRAAEVAGVGRDGAGGVEELRDSAALAWDSAERRAALAASLDHVENRAAVDARLTADLAQGRPATAAAEDGPGRSAARRTRRGPAVGRPTAQRAGHSR